jgi:hypothetical protein
VFIVVRVKCDPQFSVISEMADLKEQLICMKFCFILRKSALKMHEMLKTAFDDNAMRRTQTFECSLKSNVGKLWLKILTIQVIP